MAADLYDPSLMKGQRTEITAAKTSAITGKTESDLLNRRNATFLLIHRMIGPHKRKMIHIIHLLHGVVDPRIKQHVDAEQ